MSVLSHLKPKLMWKYFEEMCKIPHCSREEEAVGDWIMSVAEKTGHTARRDKTGNIVIEVPATPGHENAPIVVLQGHMDMVCEKNSDTVHDFCKDPIKPMIEGEYVTADGTTLGADNALGVASGLAMLEDKETVHGPLELLFTVDEETGLNGARDLSSDFLKGRILLNLDSEEEGCFSIGCAGGGDSEIKLPVTRADASGSAFEIKLYGLRGGHSGIDIHTGRGNAVQLLARMLYNTGVDFNLVEIKGGSKHNAIPREAFAQVVIPGNADDLKAVLQKRFDEIKFEFKSIEKADMAFSMEPCDAAQKPLDKASGEKVLSFITSLPHGVMVMSQEIEGLVETSTNLAIVTCEGNDLFVHMSTRSSIMSALEAIRDKIDALCALAGASVNQLEAYPAWTPNVDSKILKTMMDVYKKEFGKDAEYIAIHAGLECGIIGDKYDGMDMISFGPDLNNPHSPDECVHIGSVEKFWQLLAATLKELA